MAVSKTRFAVLGVGRIGKIHLDNLCGRIPGAEVVAVADAAPGEAAAAAARYGVARAFTDYREALAVPEVDAVVIATPTDTHFQAVLDAAAAGKHIFCEKPLDLNPARIATINRETARRGVKLMTGFNRRFDPNFLKVRQTVAAGAIGSPQVVRITSRDPAPPPENYIRSSGGLFLDMTIHDFDMARYLAGAEVTEVYARAAVLVDPVFERAGDWDTAVVTLTFDSGAIGTIDNSRQAVYGYDQRVEVFGSEGMVGAGNETADTHFRFDRAGEQRALPLHFFMERYTESYREEMRAFVDAVREDLPVPVGGHDGLMAVLIGLAAMRSARENRPVRPAEFLEGEAAECRG
jgi:myo-inositol 2-dehydrogenase/D-chiro-inositol 1-dehydrogenase